MRTLIKLYYTHIFCIKDNLGFILIIITTILTLNERYFMRSRQFPFTIKNKNKINYA